MSSGVSGGGSLSSPNEIYSMIFNMITEYVASEFGLLEFLEIF